MAWYPLLFRFGELVSPALSIDVRHSLLVPFVDSASWSFRLRGRLAFLSAWWHCDCIFVYRRSSLLSHRCLDARRFFSRVVQLLFFTSLLHSSSSSHPRTIIHRWLFPMDTSPSSLFRLPLAALAASMDACVVPMGGFRSQFEISNSIFFQGWCVRPCELFCCFVPSGGIQPSSFVSHTPLFLGN